MAGEYFTINRPRQYGKTTTLHFLATALEKLPDYLPIELNFQGIDTKWHASDKAFEQMFIGLLERELKYSQKEGFRPLKTLAPTIRELLSLISSTVILSNLGKA